MEKLVYTSFIALALISLGLGKYCERSYYTYNDQCYKYFQTPLNWDSAFEFCVDIVEAKLAPVYNEEMSELLLNITTAQTGGTRGSGWISLIKASTIALWIHDGSTFSQTWQPWSDGASNPPFCRVVLGGDGLWYAHNCSSTHTDNFWCWKDPICVNETTAPECDLSPTTTAEPTVTTTIELITTELPTTTVTTAELITTTAEYPTTMTTQDPARNVTTAEPETTTTPDPATATTTEPSTTTTTEPTTITTTSNPTITTEPTTITSTSNPTTTTTTETSETLTTTTTKVTSASRISKIVSTINESTLTTTFTPIVSTSAHDTSDTSTTSNDTLMFSTYSTDMLNSSFDKDSTNFTVPFTNITEPMSTDLTPASTDSRISNEQIVIYSVVPIVAVIAIAGGITLTVYLVKKTKQANTVNPSEKKKQGIVSKYQSDEDVSVITP